MDIRTGKVIPWFFVVIGAGGVAGSVVIYLATREPLLIITVAFFAIGTLIGIGLLVRPKRLLRIHGGLLELYTGALSHNRPKASIPLGAIEDFKVHQVHDGESTAWYLTLHLNQDRQLADDGEAWMRIYTKHTPLTIDDPQTIHWLLWAPQGGGQRVKSELDQHLSPTIKS